VVLAAVDPLKLLPIEVRARLGIEFCQLFLPLSRLRTIDLSGQLCQSLNPSLIERWKAELGTQYHGRRTSTLFMTAHFPSGKSGSHRSNVVSSDRMRMIPVLNGMVPVLNGMVPEGGGVSLRRD
jgi:hypothetical protein